jgi:Transposase IS116/IS110/IS902 family
VLEQWRRRLDRRIAAPDDEFAAMAGASRALVAAISDATTFSRARDLAAWLGLVPPQATMGGKPVSAPTTELPFSNWTDGPSSRAKETHTPSADEAA